MSAASEALVGYLAELAEQRRLSPHTVANYRRDLDKLLAAAGNTPLAQLGARTQGRMRLENISACGLRLTLQNALLAELGVKEGDIPQLARNAFADPCLVTNPVQPSLADIEQTYERALETR